MDFYQPPKFLPQKPLPTNASFEGGEKPMACRGSRESPTWFSQGSPRKKNMGEKMMEGVRNKPMQKSGQGKQVFFFFGMCEYIFFPTGYLGSKLFFEEHEWFLHKETPGIQFFCTLGPQLP